MAILTALESRTRSSSLLGKRAGDEDSFDANMSPIKDLHISGELLAHAQSKKARWQHAGPGSLSPLSERSEWDGLDDSSVPMMQRETSIETIGQMVFLDDADECDTELLISGIADLLEEELVESRLEGRDKMQPLPSDPVTIFYSAQKQKFALAKYVQRVVNLVNGSSSIFVTALCLLQRARKADAMLALHDFNVHRLWITAVVLASKMLEDEVYSNEHYARMGGVPSLGEMNRLEAAMLKKLDFSLCVPNTEYLEMRGRILNY